MPNIIHTSQRSPNVAACQYRWSAAGRPKTLLPHRNREPQFSQELRMSHLGPLPTVGIVPQSGMDADRLQHVCW
jgi:hypothetical protein